MWATISTGLMIFFALDETFLWIHKSCPILFVLPKTKECMNWYINWLILNEFSWVVWSILFYLSWLYWNISYLMSLTEWGLLRVWGLGEMPFVVGDPWLTACWGCKSCRKGSFLSDCWFVLHFILSPFHNTFRKRWTSISRLFLWTIFSFSSLLSCLSTRRAWWLLTKHWILMVKCRIIRNRVESRYPRKHDCWMMRQKWRRYKSTQSLRTG